MNNNINIIEFTKDEKNILKPLLSQITHEEYEIYKFIDTELDKIYNVYLLIEKEKRYIIKKVYEGYDEKVWYDKYFAKTDLPVPPIVNEIVINNEKYITMEYIDGKDARFCNQQEVKQVAHSLALIQNQFLENVIFSEESTNDTKQYYDRKNTRFFSPLVNLFPELNDVVEISKKRFFEAPRTMSHDDLLPINVLLADEKAWIIDWETAGIRPYFIDLARFAYVSKAGKLLYLDKDIADAFIDCFYEEMISLGKVKISKEQYLQDIAISALFQYMVFVDTYLPINEIRETFEYKYLNMIAEQIRKMQ